MSVFPVLQVFFLLKESELTPSGTNILDGRYGVFGYVVEGQEVRRHPPPPYAAANRRPLRRRRLELAGGGCAGAA